MKTNTTHKRLRGFKMSLLALSIVGSTLLHAQTVTEIPPLDYDTIQGNFEGDSLFLDTGSDTSLLSTTEWYQIQAYATAAIALPKTEASYVHSQSFQLMMNLRFNIKICSLNSLILISQVMIGTPKFTQALLI
nr:hypothetical protein [Moritella viscosa]SHO04706.1 Putative uncharacterized protein [Moritella viscosa]